MNRVVVTRKIPRVGIDALEDAGLEVVGNSTEKLLVGEELKSFVKGSDAILCLILDKVDDSVLEAAGPQLKIVANYGMGFDNIDVEAAKRRKVLVTNTPSPLSAQAVAEFTIGLMFALTKRIVETDKFARNGNFSGWKPELFIGQNLEGKTLGLIGMGNIGTRVAKMARGLGMRVVYNKKSRDSVLEKELDLEFMSLDNLLRESDLVSLHCPLTEETKGMINEEKINLMKNTAFLINTARGKIVDESALASALKTGRLAGAGLDVYEYEPEINPELLGLPNVVLTPHTASSVQEVRDEMALMAARNVIEGLRGGMPPNLVG